jgi:hypothetical protein
LAGCDRVLAESKHEGDRKSRAELTKKKDTRKSSKDRKKSSVKKNHPYWFVDIFPTSE